MEWHVTTEELVKNDTQAPNITSKIACLIQDNLRCSVTECTSSFLEHLIFLEIASQTKVSNFDLWALALRAQKDVLVFNVTVNDLFLVDVF